MSSTLRLGIDIGGTFTDLALVRGKRVVATHKLLTSPADPIRAIVEGVDEILTKAGAAASAVTDVVHGTTLVTNALIESKGARTALCTSSGFRDLLEIGNEWRYDMYDIFLDRPPLLVSRPARYEVAERTLADGSIETAVDITELESVVREVSGSADALAVCFLHSYANQRNEQMVREVAARIAPELHVSLSSEVAPEIREFERFSTATANAYVQPLVKPYLDSLKRRLAAIGVRGNLYILLSNGGVASADTASRFPIRIAESGPAAGALGAAFLSQRLREKHVIAFDMGGTTAKTCFVDDGEPLITKHFEVARNYRFKPGSGIPLNITSVELFEIGAGGGSIAHIDTLGLLRVGPESAGAEPGPICYRRGGTRPTVTDADLVLGYLNADYFLGGAMPLDLPAATNGIRNTVAGPLDVDVIAAAWGIHEVVNQNMANALRIHSAERGKDTRQYTMLAFGGAGAVHACHLAQSIGLSRVICPLRASVLSAMGMLTAPIGFDFVRTERHSLDELDWKRANELYADMLREGKAMLRAAGVPVRDLSASRSCDMRFIGQGYELTVPAPDRRLGTSDRQRLCDAFSHAYRKLFGRLPKEVGMEILNWRLRLAGREPALQLSAVRSPPDRGSGSKQIGVRPAHFPRTGLLETRVFDRYALKEGDRMAGPAVVEEIDTTTVVPPGWRAKVDRYLNLVIQRTG